MKTGEREEIASVREEILAVRAVIVDILARTTEQCRAVEAWARAARLQRAPV